MSKVPRKRYAFDGVLLWGWSLVRFIAYGGVHLLSSEVSYSFYDFVSEEEDWGGDDYECG